MSHSALNIPTETEATVSKEPCTVFLIEDDYDDRMLARKELGQSKNVADLVCFKDGEELSQYMKENGYADRSVFLSKPMLILVDLEMPKKDGLQVISELKKDTFLQEIPLIVVSGTESDAKIAKARELGANGVFRKPLKASMLDSFYKDAWQWPPHELW